VGTEKPPGDNRPYKNKEIRFCAFLMCFDVPFNGVEEDGGGRGRNFCNFLFTLEPAKANEYWMAFQNKNPKFKVDAKRYAEEYENLKSMRHRLAR
jgi:hypothetical protein